MFVVIYVVFKVCAFVIVCVRVYVGVLLFFYKKNVLINRLDLAGFFYPGYKCPFFFSLIFQ